MKTYEQLMKHYWGKIVPMAEAAGVNPWECVRSDDREFADHPKFIEGFAKYTFALTVLDGKPVFVGDKVYAKDCGVAWIVGVSDGLNWDKWSATPPTKKRTFMLGDKELPCPSDRSSSLVQISYMIDAVHSNTRIFYFESYDESAFVGEAIDYLLRAARDKE